MNEGVLGIAGFDFTDVEPWVSLQKSLLDCFKR
jgi:hypothetical protein